MHSGKGQNPLAPLQTLAVLVPVSCTSHVSLLPFTVYTSSLLFVRYPVSFIHWGLLFMLFTLPKLAPPPSFLYLVISYSSFSMSFPLEPSVTSYMRPVSPDRSFQSLLCISLIAFSNSKILVEGGRKEREERREVGGRRKASREEDPCGCLRRVERAYIFISQTLNSPPY